MPRPGSRVVLVLVLAVGALIAACNVGGGSPVSSESSTDQLSPVASAGSPGAAGSPRAAGSGATTPWLPEWAEAADVPAEIAARRMLPFCGVEAAPAPQPGEFIDRAVRLCFWNAHLAGAEAEFASVQSTMEGAAIATIYRLAADGTVEVLTDFTQDPFGGGTWQATVCREVVEGEGDALLGVAECDEGRSVE